MKTKIFTIIIFLALIFSIFSIFLNNNKNFSLKNRYFQFAIINQRLINESQRAPWDYRVERCIDRELGDIFNDNNPIDDIFFVASGPLGFAQIVLYCIFETTFG